MLRVFARVMLLPLVILLPACGGGGSDSNDFAGAGQVDLDIAPTVIDTGDRARVTVTIRQRHEDGVILKIRFPLGLSYVAESSKMTVNGREVAIDPSAIESTDRETYLVYFLDTEFGSSKDGTISFELRGVDVVNDSLIEVDLDVLDTPDFNVDDPEFSAEASKEISVRIEQ